MRKVPPTGAVLSCLTFRPPPTLRLLYAVGRRAVNIDKRISGWFIDSSIRATVLKRITVCATVSVGLVSICWNQVQAASMLESTVPSLHDGSFGLGLGGFIPFESSLWQQIAYGPYATPMRSKEAEFQALLGDHFYRRDDERRMDARTTGHSGYFGTLIARNFWFCASFVGYGVSLPHLPDQFSTETTWLVSPTDRYDMDLSRTITRYVMTTSASQYYGTGSLSVTTFAILCPILGDSPGMSRSNSHWATSLGVGLAPMPVT